MPAARPSQWSALFDIAVSIIDQAQEASYRFDWTFGGGTALMLQIDHRESHDIDLFIDDPQVVPFLNPETQVYTLNRAPDGYATDGSHVLKLTFGDVGEIDFICCASITDHPTRRSFAGVTSPLRLPPRSSRKRSITEGHDCSLATCSISPRWLPGRARGMSSLRSGNAAEIDAKPPSGWQTPWPLTLPQASSVS